MEKGVIWDINRILIDMNMLYWLNLLFFNYWVYVFLFKYFWICMLSLRKIILVWYFGCNFFVGFDLVDLYF